MNKEVPTTDPFAEKTHQSQPVEDIKIHDDFEEKTQNITKGMPKKNLKNIGLVIAGVLVFGLIFWPKDDAEKKRLLAAQQQGARTDKAAAKSILDTLSVDAEQKAMEDAKAKASEQASGIAPPGQGSIPFANGAPQYGTPSLPSVQGVPGIQMQPSTPPLPPLGNVGYSNNKPLEMNNAGTADMSRDESIVASSMTPGDFRLSDRRQSGSATPPAQNQEKGLLDFIRDQDERTQRMIASNAQPTTQQGVSQSGGNANNAFLRSAAGAGIATPDGLYAAPPPASLFQGTILRGVLTNGINTEVPGEFRARVVSDLYDSKTMKQLLIPRGSMIIGMYKSSILVGQARMVVAAQRLILPNGKSVNLAGAVLGDQQGVAGVPGEVNNHFWTMFKASAIIGAASLLLPKDNQTITATNGLGGQQTGGTILSTALSDVVTRIAQRNSSIGPTGSVDTGEIFTLMIQRDLALEPYKW